MRLTEGSSVVFEVALGKFLPNFLCGVTFMVLLPAIGGLVVDGKTDEDYRGWQFCGESDLASSPLHNLYASKHTSPVSISELLPADAMLFIYQTTLKDTCSSLER